MAKAIQQQLEMEQKAAEAKKVRNQQVLAEVEAANRVALAKKQEKIEQEKKEDL